MITMHSPTLLGNQYSLNTKKKKKSNISILKMKVFLLSHNYIKTMNYWTHKFYFYSIWMKLLFKSSFDMIWKIQVQRKVWMQMNTGGTVFTKRSNCWNIIALRRKAHWICHPKVTSRHTGPHQSCFKHTHLNCLCATRTLLK